MYTDKQPSMYTDAQPNRSIVARMVRAARFEVAVYEEVEHDRDATGQAAIVVVGTSVAWGIARGISAGDFVTLLLVVTFGLIGWALYAWITYFVGTRIFAGPETQADWGELARTLAFASSPRALLIVGIVPVSALVTAVSAVVSIWVLATTVVALRAALDFSTGRALGTAIVSGMVLGLFSAIANSI